MNDYECICKAGYTDKNCSTGIYPMNDYECICKAGYTDKNCSTGI
jgi:hypothetical protein